MIAECPVCRRPRVTESELCSLHWEAMKNIEKGYEVWQRAFGRHVTRHDYFDHLVRLEETGIAVKSVIAYMQRKSLGAA